MNPNVIMIMMMVIMRVKIPAFMYNEGRALTRRVIVDHFPLSGDRYVEPFTGSGNVFYEARSRKLAFGLWHLNDTNTFLSDLQECNLLSFPSKVDRDVFNNWKETDTPESRVFARAVSFNGWGYEHGFIGAQGYDRGSFLESCWLARTQLKTAKIYCSPWTYLPLSRLRERDFVYFDPPINFNIGPDDTDGCQHGKLMDKIDVARFKWVLTHRPNALYDRRLADYERIQIFDNLTLWKNKH